MAISISTPPFRRGSRSAWGGGRILLLVEVLDEGDDSPLVEELVVFPFLALVVDRDAAPRH